MTPDKLKFPKLPAVNVAPDAAQAYRADYGPDFAGKGVVTQEPPTIGSAFAILVPQVDNDGNEVAGIRMPELAVPIATYTGWNLFNEKSAPRSGVEHAGLVHSVRAHRRPTATRAGDPR